MSEYSYKPEYDYKDTNYKPLGRPFTEDMCGHCKHYYKGPFTHPAAAVCTYKEEYVDPVTGDTYYCSARQFRYSCGVKEPQYFDPKPTLKDKLWHILKLK